MVKEGVLGEKVCLDMVPVVVRHFHSKTPLPLKFQAVRTVLKHSVPVDDAFKFIVDKLHEEFNELEENGENESVIEDLIKTLDSTGVDIMEKYKRRVIISKDPKKKI